LVQIAFAYAYELRPHLDLLLHTLLIEDSWQQLRIVNALKGMQDDREGLFDTIHRNKSHYQKRAYQVIKCLVTLFSTCPLAAQILNSHIDMKRKWTSAVGWLHDELDRRPFATTNNQYSFNWSPPTQSNETSNGYYLERSHSARMTLAKACELCPDDDAMPGNSGADDTSGDDREASGSPVQCDPSRKQEVQPLVGGSDSSGDVIQIEQTTTTVGIHQSTPSAPGSSSSQPQSSQQSTTQKQKPTEWNR